MPSFMIYQLYVSCVQMLSSLEEKLYRCQVCRKRLERLAGGLDGSSSRFFRFPSVIGSQNIRQAAKNGIKQVGERLVVKD